jgi:hypothetical protein
MNKPGNFFDDDQDTKSGSGLSYLDGFRFGIGLMVAAVVSFVLIGGVALLLSHVFKLF